MGKSLPKTYRLYQRGGRANAKSHFARRGTVGADCFLSCHQIHDYLPIVNNHIRVWYPDSTAKANAVRGSDRCFVGMPGRSFWCTCSRGREPEELVPAVRAIRRGCGPGAPRQVRRSLIWGRLLGAVTRPSAAREAPVPCGREPSVPPDASSTGGASRFHVALEARAVADVHGTEGNRPARRG